MAYAPGAGADASTAAPRSPRAKRVRGGRPRCSRTRQRDETYDRLELALDWRPRARWTIGPQLRYTSNDSNISLYEYDRTEIQVRARYDFY
ncbi:MAG: hypothetical protein U5K43_05950 [Halofilum sp. (in: g-proteobacteria)]|nr:hypothetical protein [Halofilum sp. (in: g-proteobacteria)]